MRAIADVERFCANLGSHPLRNPKIAEEVQIEICAAAAPQRVEAGVAEGGGSDRRKRQGIEVRLATETAAYNRGVGQDLICRLRVAGTIARSGRRSNAEGNARITSEHPADCPTA